MPLFQFPSHVVFWKSVEHHKEIKAKYLPIIRELEETTKDNKPFSACHLNTSILTNTNFIDHNDKEVFDRIIWNPLSDFMNEVEKKCGFLINVKSSFVHNYWYNVYDVGDFQEQHDHLYTPELVNGEMYHPTFSLIYILHDENNDNKTLFMTEKNVPFRPIFIQERFDTGNVKDIKEGTVLIFSSHLAHLVKPVNFAGRTTIAFNIFSTF